MTNEQVVELLRHLAKIANALDRLAQPWDERIELDDLTPQLLLSLIDLRKVGTDLAVASQLANRIAARTRGNPDMINSADAALLECQ